MSFKLERHREITQITTTEDTGRGIMSWGLSNCFPSTFVNLIEQSSLAKNAVSRSSTFLKGKGFEGENEIVSPEGLTLKQAVAISCDDMALFDAFAVQCNYNIKGQVVGINPMRIPVLRFSKFDELDFAAKIGYHRNFGNNSSVRKTVNNQATASNIKWFNKFNPNNVVKQIIDTEGGIDNYLGQILYHSESGMSSYPIPKLQSAINYVLSDIENSILVRKETSTGFISSYILKTTLSSEDKALITLEKALIEAQGARGSGKIITFSGMSPDDLSATLLEEIGTGGAGAKAIMESVIITYDLAQKVVNSAYLIPNALAGVDNSTGFSGEDLKEAYFTFNSFTQNSRDMIEQQYNRILENSIFKTKSIKINKLTLDEEQELEDINNKKTI